MQSIQFDHTKSGVNVKLDIDYNVSLDSHAAIDSFFAECPSGSQEAAERTDWTDGLFLKSFAPKSKYKHPSMGSIKASQMNLCKFLSGMNDIYSDIYADMTIALLAMPNPSNLDTLLFEEFLSEDGIPISGSPAILDQNVAGPISGQKEDYSLSLSDDDAPHSRSGLAENVMRSDDVPTSEIMNEIPAKSITQFWESLTQKLLSVADQGTITKEHRLYHAVVGLLILHSLKLMCRSVPSTIKSMRARLNPHFRSIYGVSGWTLDIIPPHKDALTQLQVPFNSMDKEVLKIVGLLCAKLIFVSSSPTPDQNVKGLLFGSCLTHIGMFGLAPIKHLEQAAVALNMTTGAFGKLIYTMRTKESIDKCIKFLTVVNKVTEKVKYLDQELNLKGQITWRFARLFNQAYFNRFRTALNTRLIIRCAAFIKAAGKSQDIENMTVLSSAVNRNLFDQDLQVAEQYLSSNTYEQDKPLSKDATSVFGQTTPRMPDEPF
ncbi:ORF1 [Wuhan House Fly Virus 2]|uniref:Nucleoprotein n=1 Tax=Wuhan House Fly Virus 2 TaxID=1608105 RepID=A0A0B5KF10_9RHAB|nr:ORF1 [Wuhan House Fly Virus 2]AJG39169.1 ORF1 [Wuhan House Fly Virus 2]